MQKSISKTDSLKALKLKMKAINYTTEDDETCVLSAFLGDLQNYMKGPTTRLMR